MSLAVINNRILSDLQRIDLIKRIVVILTPRAESDVTIAELITVLNEKREQLEKAVLYSSKSDLTEIITDSDDLRDESLRMISGTCRLNMNKRVNTVRIAAETVWSLYSEVFDGVSLDNNTEESAAIAIFLEKAVEQTIVDALSTLRLTSEMETLAESNTTFVTTTAERAKIKEGDDSLRLVPSRREIQRELKFLASYLNYKERRESSDYIELISELNGPIKEIMASAKAEVTRNENDQ